MKRSGKTEQKRSGKTEQKRSGKIERKIRELERLGRLDEEKSYIQHGTTTVFDHSVDVAYMSLYLADLLHLKVDKDALIRGALLQDYFLYDWHDGAKWHRLHGFRHPKTALKNAEKDFDLTDRERNIIARHMFPLTPIPPRYKEAWLVCLADKLCALGETFRSRA